MADKTMDNLNVKINHEDKVLFQKITSQLGTTPSDAVRMFVRAFNECQDFPFDTSRPYRLSSEARKSLDEVDRQIAEGTARRYSSVTELRNNLNL